MTFDAADLDAFAAAEDPACGGSDTSDGGGGPIKPDGSPCGGGTCLDGVCESLRSRRRRQRRRRRNQDERR